MVPDPDRGPRDRDGGSNEGGTDQTRAAQENNTLEKGQRRTGQQRAVSRGPSCQPAAHQDPLSSNLLNNSSATLKSRQNALPIQLPDCMLSVRPRATLQNRGFSPRQPPSSTLSAPSLGQQSSERHLHAAESRCQVFKYSWPCRTDVGANFRLQPANEDSRTERRSIVNHNELPPVSNAVSQADWSDTPPFRIERPQNRVEPFLISPQVGRDSIDVKIFVILSISLALKPERQHKNKKIFVTEFAQHYNDQVATRHPRMHTTMVEDLWNLKTITPAKWLIFRAGDIPGISNSGLFLLRSPAFFPAESHQWREDIHAFWTFIQKHYRTEPNDSCNRVLQIRISGPRIKSLRALKQLHQATAHFGLPLNKILVDNCKDGFDPSNLRARLSVDASNPPRDPDRTPASFIAALEATYEKAIASRAFPEDSPWALRLIKLINQRQQQYQDGWVFSRLDLTTWVFHVPGSIYGDLSGDATWWTDFIVCYIQAAVDCPSPAELRQIPRTEKGLRYFVTDQRRLEERRRELRRELWGWRGRRWVWRGENL